MHGSGWCCLCITPFNVGGYCTISLYVRRRHWNGWACGCVLEVLKYTSSGVAVITLKCRVSIRNDNCYEGGHC